MKTEFFVSPPVIAEVFIRPKSFDYFERGSRQFQDDFFPITSENCLDAPDWILSGSTSSTEPHLFDGALRFMVYPTFENRP